MTNEKHITVTFLITSFDFTFLWSQAHKKGGAFNEFVIDYYIEEIAENFPDVETVIPKFYLTIGNAYSLVNLLSGSMVRRDPDSEYNSKEARADRLLKNFFVNERDIINPLKVGSI